MDALELFYCCACCNAAYKYIKALGKTDNMEIAKQPVLKK